MPGPALCYCQVLERDPKRGYVLCRPWVASSSISSYLERLKMKTEHWLPEIQKALPHTALIKWFSSAPTALPGWELASCTHTLRLHLRDESLPANLGKPGVCWWKHWVFHAEYLGVCPQQSCACTGGCSQLRTFPLSSPLEGGQHLLFHPTRVLSIFFLLSFFLLISHYDSF